MRQLQEGGERVWRDRLDEANEALPERLDLPNPLADQARQKGGRYERLKRLVGRDGLNDLQTGVLSCCSERL